MSLRASFSYFTESLMPRQMGQILNTCHVNGGAPGSIVASITGKPTSPVFNRCTAMLVITTFLVPRQGCDG